ncbi:phage tail protein [Sphingomonas elodea]|uniref:phage tail protein n=1 Tax=Sphingomonas elodea TaxID=179878 RepID=UPI0002631719|nr:phage tail protein [Sphingomonas elodea]
MNKPDSLRCILLAHVPQLRDDPSKLSMFVDRGRVAARPGSLAFEYRYTLNIVAQDYAGSIDGLMVPILAWISEAQPDLLQTNPQEPFRFESELLSADAADVSIWIELTEIVTVQPLETGGFTTSHPAQTGLVDAFDGVGCVSLLQLLLRDVPADETRLVAEHAQ